LSKILVPVDGSENSKRAAAFAAGMAGGADGARVTLLQVIVPVEKYLKFYADLPMPQVEDDLKQYAEESIAEAAHAFTAKDLPVESDIVYGDPGEAIAKYAADHGFDQIVMGTRGMGDLKGLILGSVSHQVIHFAKCPVTLVK